MGTYRNSIFVESDGLVTGEHPANVVIGGVGEPPPVYVSRHQLAGAAEHSHQDVVGPHPDT